MQYVYDAAVGAVLFAWLVASAIVQFKSPRFNFLKRHDLFSLIPSWTFFAPRAGTYDCHLVFRERLLDGQITVWKELQLRDVSPLRVFWNPSKRSQKTLSDFSGALVRMSGRKMNRRQVYLSMPYVALANFVANLPASTLVRSRQFAVARTFGFIPEKDLQLIFRSGFHAVPETRPLMAEELNEIFGMTMAAVHGD
jgi:hypothetical protein